MNQSPGNGTIKLTAAQMSTLECAVGVFELDEPECVYIRSQLHGRSIVVSEQNIKEILDLANGFDEVGHYVRNLDKETRQMYLRDSRNLYRLLEKMQVHARRGNRWA